MGWAYGKPPADLAPGWYPTLVCYDIKEGALPAPHYWDGHKWRVEQDIDTRSSYVVAYWPERFEFKEEAENFSLEQDPDA